MTNKLFILVVSLFFTTSVHSQNILTDINKYDLGKIENQAVRKGRKLLKTSKERHLSVFTYFAVGLSDYFFQETGTYDDSCKCFIFSDKGIGSVDDFLKNFRLVDNHRYYVYDDSLNIIAMAIGKTVYHYASTTPDNKYIEYIARINPKYIFEYIYCSSSFPMYFCYKDGGIIIVHLSDDGKDIVSYPLSELKDWKWLNTGKFDKIDK